ncbi:hypothetical protein KTH76_12000 [Acinetobacter baumannii]|nr:hypothetical protein [Acinetobacter baumannii]EXE39609.1 hypothetical protein J573_0871 [Acinetobacter baumannii 1546444]MBR8608774.1 hypothetical protein [Acinetobacter baumannii]MCT9290029.1 hypothetical protein [Acinetobacter baumannii]MCV2391612.1 hypothetical protein [Acinetobacter baumannii]MDC4918654.1 hypothetical protein [Acinetobacter baumannii]
MKDLVYLFIDLIKLIFPLFLRIDKDIENYGKLVELETDPNKKEELKIKIKELYVQKMTRSSKFDYFSMMEFNKKYPRARLGSYHYRYMSKQEGRYLIFEYDQDFHVTAVYGWLNYKQFKIKFLKAAIFLLLGYFFMNVPNILTFTSLKSRLLDMNDILYFLPHGFMIIGLIVLVLGVLQSQKVITYQYLKERGVITVLPFI